jgi:hypothetical protein
VATRSSLAGLLVVVLLATVGCGGGKRRASDHLPGPHPPGLAAAGKGVPQSETRPVRSASRVPDHQPNGARCLAGGFVLVEYPYVMASWFRVGPGGSYEKVEYQPLLYVWSGGGWRLYLRGTIWGAYADSNGLVRVGNETANFYWVALTARNSTGKTFSGLGPGYYKAAVKFIWPAANRSVTEWAGDHYYWDTGATAQYCTFVKPR